MQEYIERYEPFALWLNERGIAVFGHDHIGHGESVRGPEEWGVMSPEHPADIMVEDIFRNYQLGKEKWPGSPFFLLGHSMGSYLVRMFLGKKAECLDGLDGTIVMGTGSLPDSSLRFGRAVLKLIAAFRGWNYRSELVQKLSFSQRKFQELSLPPHGSKGANQNISNRKEGLWIPVSEGLQPL